MSTPPKTPQRQIRALHGSETITVYQAYSSAIASAAVAAQCLSASPSFSTTRMTWIKPSWAWMLYRSGYSYKDPRQERILALRMKHADFIYLLEQGILDSHAKGGTKRKGDEVRIQWDPERNVRLDKVDYRSVQIGIPAGLSERWAKEMIVEIEDVTEMARELKRVLDARPDVTAEELVELGLVPVEEVFDIPESVREKLRMD
ncbi:hypothetical protein QBC42DRAFT_260543 [Cladorrhinum samala]|uniref:ATP-dependent RNA helicase DHX8 n=1 Tax=Cladorrhinum samala TaxID=585594 RepID=A0AAV9HYS6_9PEZI|nr:hypothetical protein QBC42DRAFT_260543 [Cladorrhinum samala]